MLAKTLIVAGVIGLFLVLAGITVIVFSLGITALFEETGIAIMRGGAAMLFCGLAAMFLVGMLNVWLESGRP